MLELSEHLRASLPRGREFDAVMQMTGEVFREHKNRRTIRSQIGGRVFFIKTHGPTGWREILKNALRGRWPVLTARPEWLAIKRLESLKIPTLRASGFGSRGRSPHQLESFIVTDELEGMIHVSDLAARLGENASREAIRVRRRLLKRIADVARTLHLNGLNHRDFYLCHFMLRDGDWRSWACNGSDVELHLIDLHRVQMRRAPAPRRWVIKDLSGLLFSALDAGLTARDYVRFLRAYWGRQWKTEWRRSRGWRRAIVRRAVSLYRSEHGRSPRLPDGLANS